MVAHKKTAGSRSRSQAKTSPTRPRRPSRRSTRPTPSAAGSEPLDFAREVDAFRRAFTAAGSKAQAEGAKAYLKSQLEFLGVALPGVRSAAAEFCRAHPALSREALRALAVALYETPVHELRSVALAMLERKHSLLGPEDLDWLLGLVRKSDTWANVDWIAAMVMGHIFERHPELSARLGDWAKDENFWVRRTALLAQLLPLRKGHGDFETFARIAVPMLEEKEFFIRKALGWVLREVSRKRPELTYGFLREHGHRASGLTLREASRHLPARMLEALKEQRGS